MFKVQNKKARTKREPFLVWNRNAVFLSGSHNELELTGRLLS